MPTNLIKIYDGLLEITHLAEPSRTISLRRVFDRDIQNNENFKFRLKMIRPTKKDGEDSMGNLFNHLTRKVEKDPNDPKNKKRVFETARSERLHWIRFHVEEKKKERIEVFSYLDKIEGRGLVIRTYIYDIDKQYVIILEPQKSQLDYYLITAYHLNEPGSRKQIEHKYKKQLPEIY